MKITPILATSALYVTAACGGGSTGADDMATFGTLDAMADDLISAYVFDTGAPAAGLSRTDDLSSLGGSATYTGAFRGAIDGNRVVGDITLTTDIADGAVTGEGSNFQHERDGAYSGTLTGSGQINSTSAADPQVSLNLQGTLTGAGGAHPTFILLDGDFYASGSDSGAAIAGPAEGDIGDDFITDAVFAVER